MMNEMSMTPRLINRSQKRRDPFDYTTRIMTPQRIRMFKYLSLNALILSSTLLVASCGDSGDAAMAEPTQTTTPGVRTVQVETIRVEPTRFEDMIALIGVVESPRDAILSAQSTGTLIRKSELGAELRQGAIVAQIDAVLISAALDQARANLASTQARAALSEDIFRRQEPLYADSIISALEYEQLQSNLNSDRAQLNQAEALVAQAEKQLENTYVRAPFGGRVEEVFVERGEQVMPGAQIVRLVDTENLKIKAGVPERYAIDIRKGTPVTIVFKAYGVGERAGEITFVGSVIDPQNRSFAIEVALANPEGSLKPEMVADLFVTRSVLEGQIVLPQTSILRDETGSSVYVVDRSAGNAIARRKQISLGSSFDGRTVVTSGLESGDEVIVIGQTYVTEGDAVQTAPAEA